MKNIGFDSLKMEAVINRIVNEYYYRNLTSESIKLSRGILHKLCYMVDFKFYSLYDRSMTGETYVHSRNGPVPIHFNTTVDNLITDRRLVLDKDDYSPLLTLDYTPPVRKKMLPDDCQENYDPILDAIAYHRLPDITPDEASVIKEVVSAHIGKTARELEPIVKTDPPWVLSSEGQALDYELVFYRKNVQLEMIDEEED